MRTPKHPPLHSFSWIALACAGLFSFALESRSYAENTPPVPAPSEEQEFDLVAASSQKAAIDRLRKVIPQRRGAPDEADLVFALAELLFRSGDFKIQQSDETFRKEALQEFRESVSTFDRFESIAPRDSRIPQVLYMRGRAQLDLGQNDRSTHDFSTLATRFPKSQETKVSLPDLIELLMQAQKYDQVIQYFSLIQIEAKNPLSPILLRHLMWAQYKTGQLLPARLTMTRLLGLLQTRPDQDPTRIQIGKSSADLLPALTLEGLSKKLPGFEIELTLQNFRRTLGPTFLGPAISSFALQLRAANRLADLEVFKNQVVTEESDRKESVEVVAFTIEGNLNSHRYDSIPQATQQFRTLAARHPQAVSQSVVSLLPRFREVFEKNRDSASGRPLAIGTSQLISTALQDSKLAPARRSELLLVFGALGHYLKDYDGALRALELAVRHQPKSSEAARLASLAIHLDKTRDLQLLPQKIAIRPVAQTTQLQGGVPLPIEAFALATADALQFAQGTHPETMVKLDQFRFESARALYHHGSTVRALELLTQFVEQRPDSAYASPASGIVMDTWIASKNWERADQFSKMIASNQSFKNNDLKNKIKQAGTDARVRGIETDFRNKKYESVQRGASQLLAENPSHPSQKALWVMVAQSSQALGQKQQAIQAYSQVATQNEATPELATSLIERAKLLENSYQFSAAAKDYLRFLSLPSTLQGISSSQSHSLKVRANKLAWIESPSSAPPESRYPEFSMSWAAKRRLEWAQELSKKFLTADPDLRLTWIPSIHRDLSSFFSAYRADFKRRGPLQIEAAAIKERLEVLGSLESSITTFKSLGLNRVTVTSAKELSNLYLSTALELKNPELSKPIYDKASEYDRAAYELATSEGVELEVVQWIIGTRRSNLPSLAMDQPLSDRWYGAIREEDANFRVKLKEAYSQRNPALIAFLGKELQSRGSKDSTDPWLLQAIALNTSGAQSEALTLVKKQSDTQTTIWSKDYGGSVVAPALVALARSGARNSAKNMALHHSQSLGAVDPSLMQWLGIPARLPAGEKKHD